MDSVKWPMLFVCLCFRVTQTIDPSWKVTVPSSVKGLPGSCVVIPCSFNYPDTDKRITAFLGMWFIAGGSSIIYHPDESKMIKEFQGRTELLGDVRQKNCSLKIDPLKSSDSGPFFFRIEMEGYDKFSYREQTSITMMSELNDITFTVKEDLMEGQTVVASCSVPHSCPTSPPDFTWSLPGKQHFQPRQLVDGQWTATSTLHFLPTRADHDKLLRCNVTYKGGQSQKAEKLLRVKHMPEIKTVSSCSSEAHMVKCVCIAESQPVSMIHFVLPDRVLPRVKVEQHGTVTIGTLHAEFGSSRVVLCVANNTLGNANITLSLPVNSTMQNLYIVIASGAAGILVTVLIAVRVFKKCKRKSANAQTRHIVPEKTDKDVALPHCSATKRKEKRYEDVHSADIFDNNHVYGNMETDCDEAIYANM
uniref:myelin-associated glycoprotein-like isoform X2 n=1 Tax=Gasterosteus aculeatus aculeatus TaxID=481459 RepID=UPI001A98236D|nr:myelin-associated glycoprotein-like isoform X2 [Gasterosteus aculeatus aculeatus]